MSRRRRLLRRRRRKANSRDRSRRPAAQSPTPKLELEYLEPRILLTTLFGGETFRYALPVPTDPLADFTAVPLAEITLTGDIIAEVIAIDFDNENNFIFGDMSGTIMSSALGRAGERLGGGIGGQDGVEPVTGDNTLGAPTNIADPQSADLSFSALFNSLQVNIHALASRDGFSGGETYGINTTAPSGGVGQFQLVQLDTATGAGTSEALLNRATLAEDVMTRLQDGVDPVEMGNVQAFAVDRTDPSGRSYFINLQGLSSAESALFSVNRFSGIVTSLGTITNTDVATPIPNVRAMAFDDAGDLHFLINDINGDGTLDDPGFVNLGDPQDVLFDTDFAAGDVVAITGVGPALEDMFFTAMDFRADGAIIATSRDATDPGAPNQLLQINSATGITNILGDIPDTVQVEGLAYSRTINGVRLVGTGTLEGLPGVLFTVEVPGAPVADQLEIGLLNVPGDSITTLGLSSFTEVPGQGDLLFALDEPTTSGNALVRGSSVALPVDPDTGLSAVSALNGADFRPTSGSAFDGMLYLGASVQPLIAGSLADGHLYTIDVDRLNRSAIQNSLAFVQSFGYGIGFQSIDSMAWELRLDDANNLQATLSILYGVNPTEGDPYQGITTYASAGGATVSADSQIGFVRRLPGQPPLVTMRGIEFINDDPLIEEPYIFATTGTELLRLERFGGTPPSVYSYGFLEDADDETPPIRGLEISGVAWSPTLISPFTGTQGALLGTDVATDDLLFIDHRPRLSTADTFLIYVNHASPDATISATQLDGLGLSLPIGGPPITIQPVILPNGAGFYTASPEAGRVILGGRTENVNPETTDEELILVTQGFVDTQFGIRPLDYDDRPDLTNINVASGLHVVGSLLEHFDPGLGLANTLGQNFDIVRQLAVSADGQSIVALDIDRLGPDGNSFIDLDGNGQLDAGEPIIGAQLGFINPLTGRIESSADVVSVFEALTGLVMTDLTGLAYGDADLDITTGALPSGEDLYAIALVSAPAPIDRSGEGIGGVLVDDAFAPVPASVDLGGVIHGLAVDAGGVGFAVLERPATPLELVQITRLANGGIRTTDTIGQILSFDWDPAVLDFDLVENVRAMERNSQGEMTFIGNFVGDAADTQRVFVLSDAVGDFNGDGFQDIFAYPHTDALFNLIDIDTDGTNATPDPTSDLFTVMAQHVNGTMYVVREFAANDYRLYELDQFTNVLTEVVGATTGNGQLMAGGLPVIASAGDFDRDNNLLIVDRNAAAGDGWLVAVNFADPGLSTVVTGTDTIPTDLSGFTNDINGLNLALKENGIGGVGFEDELWVSTGGTQTLGTIDGTTGAFTPVGPILDFVGNALPAGVLTMAFSPGEGSIPGQQGLFAMTANGGFWEIDPLTGDLIDTSGNTIVDITAPTFQIPHVLFGPGPDDVFFTVDDDVVDVKSMDFDSNGQLIAQVSNGGKIIDIDMSTRDQPLMTFGQVVNTDVGSVRPTVGAIAYDAANNDFLVVDNSTGFLRLEEEGSSPVESAILMRMPEWSNGMEMAQSLDKFHWAGLITGHVDVFGSINQFYVGWLATGDAGPSSDTIDQLQPAGTVPLPEDNFFIAGDLRVLIINWLQSTLHPIEEIVSELDIQIRGRLGEYLAIVGGATGALIEVENDDGVPATTALQSLQTEYEGRYSLTDQAGQGDIDAAWALGDLWFGDDRFFNDTPHQAQRLGTVASGIPGVPDSIRLLGQTNFEVFADPDAGGDAASTGTGDWFAVGLVAGQEMTVGVTGSFQSFTVFDPELRGIVGASASGAGQAANRVRVKADIPGEYYIHVVDGILDEEPDVDGTFGFPYLLEISDMEKRDDLGALQPRANIGVGGIVSREGVGANITLLRGDLGSIYGTGVGGTAVVTAGDLRSMDTLGGVGGIFDASGDIGLVRGLGGVLGLFVAGNDIQIIETLGEIGDPFGTRFEAGGGIGSVRAGSVWGPSFPFFDGFYVDADNTGNDGFIDVIDVIGDWGTFLNGGAPIDTGTGGNVRYMRVGGELWTDLDFGASSPPVGTTDITLTRGESVTLTDDGGGTLNILHLGEEFVPDPADVLLAELDPTFEIPIPTVTISAYPIRSGGVVVTHIEAESSLQVFGDLVDPRFGLEIGEITIEGAEGPSIVFDQLGNIGVGSVYTANGVLLPEIDPQELDLTIVGTGVVSVWDVQAAGSNFGQLSNVTGGDIANLNILGAVNLYSAGSIGITEPVATQAAVGGSFGSLSLPVFDEGEGSLGFPHALPRTLIQAENILSMRADKAIANIEVLGHLKYAQANNDFIDDPDVFEGIAGPVHAGGNIGTISVGEGVLPSGPGLRRAGIYAGGSTVFVVGGDDQVSSRDLVEGNIGLVINQGAARPTTPLEFLPTSDIRGDIMAMGTIHDIRLHNGSLINNIVAAAQEVLGTPFFETLEDPFPDIIHELTINLSGPHSGIIGSLIASPDPGNITVLDGFGIFSTEVWSVGASRVGNISAAGYGISDVFVWGGTEMSNLTATGRGDPVTTDTFSPSVRHSEQFEFDPFTGLPPSANTDIYFHLPGVRVDDPNTPGREDAFLDGRISEFEYIGARSMGLITAHRVEDSEVTVGDRFGGITTRGSALPFSISGASILAGSMQTFTPHAGIEDSSITLAGPIRTMIIRGDVSNTLIAADGPGGDINYLRVMGDMSGTISAHGVVRTLWIDGDLSGNLIIDGVQPGHTALWYLYLGGSLSDGSFDIDGHVGTMIVRGSFGTLGAGDGLEDRLIINGNLTYLSVGLGDVTPGGDTMTLDLAILGNAGQIAIDGAVMGDVVVTGKLSGYRVTADTAQTGTAIQAGRLSVGDDLGFFSVRNGDVGDGVGTDVLITAGGALRTVMVYNGDIASDVILTSSLEDITTVMVTGGDMLGGLAAPNGAIQSLSVNRGWVGGWVGGDIGGDITALAMRSLRAQGSILTGTNISVRDGVGYIYLGGDLEVNASMDIGFSRTVNILGSVHGDLSLGMSTTRTTFMVTRDLTGSVAIGGDAMVRVGRMLDAAAAPSIWIGGNGDVFVNGYRNGAIVTGDLTGVVTIVGKSNIISAQTMTDAVVTTGLDLISMRVLGATNNSLVQVGTRPGIDNVFDTDDLDEGTSRAKMQVFTGRDVSNSIFAASGNIVSFNAIGDMLNTTASSGFVIGQSAIAAVIADHLTTPLDPVGTEQNDARGAADRVLYHGDFTSARATGTMTASFFSAGVDPGPNGMFEGEGGGSDDTVTSSMTGGRSLLRTAFATTAVGSGVVADNGVTRAINVPLLGTNAGRVDYDVMTDLIDIGGTGTPLEPFVGTASFGIGNEVTVNGLTFSINVPGAEINVYDDPATTDRVDTIILREDANPLTRYAGTASVKVFDETFGSVGVGRILTADDFAFMNFVMTDASSRSFYPRDTDVAGVVLGDGGLTDDPDVWVDSGLLGFKVGQYGPDAPTTQFTGRFGGDVNTFSFGILGSTTTHIGGRTITMNALPSYQDQIIHSASPAGDFTVADDFGSDRDFVDIVVRPDGAFDMFAIVETPFLTNGFHIAHYSLDASHAITALNSTNLITVAGGGGDPITHISAIALDPEGPGTADDRILIVGDNPENVLRQQELFTVDHTTGLATSLGPLLDGLGRTVVQTIEGLAFDPITDDLYGIRDYGGRDNLLSINENTGAFIDMGWLRLTDSGRDQVLGTIDDRPMFTNANAATFNASGDLIILDRSYGVNAARRVQLAAADLANPDAATELTPRGSESATTAGLTNAPGTDELLSIESSGRRADAPPLLIDDPAAAPANLSEIAIHSTFIPFPTVSTFVFDDVARQLTEIGGATVDVTDVLAGLVDLEGIAFDGAGQMYGVGDIFNQNPIDEVGTMVDAPRQLVGLTSRPGADGDELFAAETSAFQGTGSFTADIDTFVDLAANSEGNVYGIVDVGGLGTTFQLRQVLLDGAYRPAPTVTDPDATITIGDIEFGGIDVADISAAAFNPVNDQLYVVGSVAPPISAVDPMVAIYDANGVRVDFDLDSGADGVSASLTYVVGFGGPHIVAVLDELPVTPPPDPYALPGLGANTGDFHVQIGLNPLNAPTTLTHIEEGVGAALVDATVTDLTSGNSIVSAAALGDDGDPAASDIDMFILDAEIGDVIQVDAAAASNQVLFVVDLASGVATPVAGLFDTVSAASVTEDILGLAFQSDGTLYGVRDTVGGETLLLIDSTDGVSTDMGAIAAFNPTGGVQDATITDSAAFSEDDELILLERGLGAGQARRVLVNLLAPDNSSQLTPKGSESDTAVGLTYLSGTDRSLSIETNGGAADDMLTSSVTYDRLVFIDSSTGVVHDRGRIADPDNNFHSSNITAIAAAPSGLLWMITNDADGVGRGHDVTTGAAFGHVEATDVTLNGTIDFTNPFVDSLRPQVIDSDPITPGTQIITDPLHSMSSSDDAFHVFRRSGGQDFLTLIEMLPSSPFVPGTSSVFAVPLYGQTGLVQYDTDIDGVPDTDTSIAGSGFDANGNLIALNMDGVNNGLIYYNMVPAAAAHVEGDNTFAAANVTGLAVGDVVFYETTIGDHGVPADADIDLYSVGAAAGQVIQVDVRKMSASLNPTIGIYDSAGNLVASDLDSGLFLDAKLTYLAPAPDTYFILVSGIDAVPPDPHDPNPAAEGTTGDYRVRVALDSGVGVEDRGLIFQPVTAPNLVDPGLDAFAITRGTTPNLSTFAYDTNDDARPAGMLFRNPGVITTLGLVESDSGDPNFGTFTQLLPLTEDAMGTPLSSSAVTVAVDSTGTGDVFVVTADDRLLQYDAADGSFVHDYGPIMNELAHTLDITSLVLNPDPASKPGTIEFIAMDQRFSQLYELVVDPPAPFAVDPTGDTTEIEMARPRTGPGTVQTTTLNDLAVDNLNRVWHGIEEGTPDQLITFRDPNVDGQIDETDPASVRLDSLIRMAITGSFDGRIETTGNTIQTIQVRAGLASPNDNVTGQLISNTDVVSYQQFGTDFDGTVRARRNIRNAFLNNSDIGPTAVMDAGMTLSSYRGMGEFAGLLNAHAANSVNNTGLVTNDGLVNIEQTARVLNFGNDFEGEAVLGWASSLRVTGAIGNGGLIHVDNDANSVYVGGGVDPTGMLRVLDDGRVLNVRGGHEGVIAYRGNLTTALLTSLTRSLLAIGGDATNVLVSGVTLESVVTFGTWFGDDYIYNTDDDVIFGGSARNVSYRDDYIDSATIAGVLPREGVAVWAGTPNLPADMRAYTGNFGGAAIADTDSAEAGGIRPSTIGRVTMSRDILGTAFSSGVAGREAIIAAADDIGTLFTRAPTDRLIQREYPDPFDAPQVTEVIAVATNEVQVLFNEEMNSGAFILSQDRNNDGDLLDEVDLQGSVSVRDGSTGAYLNHVVLTYSRDVNADAFPSDFFTGVLTITDPTGDGFGTDVVSVDLFGTPNMGHDVLYDRTGLRSAVRDFDQNGLAAENEDPYGTLFDGDNNSVEGGDRTAPFLIGDAPDDFLTALNLPSAVPVDQPVQLTTTLDSGDPDTDDIDIFRVDSSDPWQFLGVNYVGPQAQMGLFHHDDQGTVTTADDMFEAVTRWEYTDSFTFGNPSGWTMFQAAELAEAGTYFIVITGSDTGNYTLNMALGTTDTSMITALGTSWPDDPIDEPIAYASNFIGQHNNLLGANTPKQLVYLDFDGGMSTRTFLGDVEIAPFDAGVLDPGLAFSTDQLINGGGGVTGIVDNILTIFTDIPASTINPETGLVIGANPLGVNRIDATGLAGLAGNINNLTDGLTFTTVDPALYGFDPFTEFYTVFTGETDAIGSGLLGLAQHIDQLNDIKGDEAIVFLEGYANQTNTVDVTARMNEYSRALANVIAHELGHNLGLNHHPTTFDDYELRADDPDNDPVTPDDSNTGSSLMAYAPLDEDLSVLLQLGTSILSPPEFPIGDSDLVDLLLRALT